MFVSGKIFDGSPIKKDGSPLSQPPTPPSTPLSPKHSDLSQRLYNLSNLSLSQQTPQSSQKLPHSHKSSTQQSMPLNLGKKSVPNASSTAGINLSSQQLLDFSQSSGAELEALRTRITEDSFNEQKNALGGRVS